MVEMDWVGEGCLNLVKNGASFENHEALLILLFEVSDGYNG